jgi:hypothetical protein
VPLIVCATLSGGETHAPYLVCVVFVAPKTAESVVNALFHFAVDVLYAAYAAESRSHAPSAKAGENGALPVDWKYNRVEIGYSGQSSVMTMPPIANVAWSPMLSASVVTVAQYNRLPAATVLVSSSPQPTTV